MWLYILAIVAGLLVLTHSADRFVVGAAATARILGMPMLLIGLTIVSFGTSAPELLVSAIASWTGVGNLAVGNALGSNIANVGLVLGLTALVAPISVPRSLFGREFLLMVGATLLGGYAIHDLKIDLVDACLLVTGLAFALWQFARQGASSGEGAEIEQEVEHSIPEMALGAALLRLFSGLLLLLVSSRVLVWGASEMARSLGVSDLIIGLTIVAIGTSLPELAASMASALKKHHDLAIGTVVGSNIFNLLGVLALPGFFGDLTLEASALWRDYSVMLVMTLLLILFSWLPSTRFQLSRLEGLLLSTAYLAYLLFLYLQLSGGTQ